MRVEYDPEGDLLFVEFIEPTDDSQTVDAGDGVLLILDASGESVQAVEIWSCRARGAKGEAIDVPVTVDAARRLLSASHS